VNTMHYYQSDLLHHRIGYPYMMICNNFKQTLQENFTTNLFRTKSQPLAIFVQVFGILCLSSILLLTNIFPLFADESFNDQDDSQVEIEVNVTAYTGWDGGLGCPGYSSAYGQSGDYVTLCFAITNTSNKVSQNIQVANTLYKNITVYNSPLWPGSTVILWYQGILGESIPTEIVVQASTTSEIDSSSNFSGNQFRTVPIQQRSPSMELNSGVYLGHDGGEGCENSGNQIEAISSQLLTYCFEVFNDGETYLNDIQIVAPILSMDQSDLLLHSGQLPLAPNNSLIYYHQTQAVGNLKPTTRVRANPVDSNGNDLPELSNPYADSSVTLRTPANTPGIMLVKTAYVKTSEASRCPGKNLVQAISDQAINYCLEIVNTGSTHLDSLQIVDTNLGLEEPLSISLRPSESQPFSLPAKRINADVLNTASVEGNGIDSEGIDIPGRANPVHQDRAFVDIIKPALTLEKSVYLGRDGGARCPGTAEISGGHNYDITYCYTIRNTGDVDLANIQIEDKTLGITQRNLNSLDMRKTLSPDSQTIWYYETKLDGASVVPTTANANPVDQNGLDIPHISNPSAESTAQARLSSAPALIGL